MKKSVLMCPPDYFDIEYEINPWMHQDSQPSGETAHEQWQKLHDIYRDKLGWQVELIQPVKHLPDMVFITDSALIIDNKVLLNKFRYAERESETAYCEAWLKQNGYTQIKQASYFVEGGDLLAMGDKILWGYGFRS